MLVIIHYISSSKFSFGKIKHNLKLSSLSLPLMDSSVCECFICITSYISFSDTRSYKTNDMGRVTISLGIVL